MDQLDFLYRVFQMAKWNIFFGNRCQCLLWNILFNETPKKVYRSRYILSVVCGSFVFFAVCGLEPFFVAFVNGIR